MSGKHTAISIAHEMCIEYDIGCVVCGDTDIEMHHYPTKGQMKKRKLSEILFVTIFPMCRECHTNYHTKGNTDRESVIKTLNFCVTRSSRRIYDKRYCELTREHIDRIIARNVNTLE
jgi:hypothetical protein